MKTTPKVRHEFSLGGATELRIPAEHGSGSEPAGFVLDGNIVRMRADGLLISLHAETLERIAAALAEHRSLNFDSRSACPDHGYQSFSDSKTAYRCPVCDPKNVDATPPGGDDEAELAHEEVPL